MNNNLKGSRASELVDLEVARMLKRFNIMHIHDSTEYSRESNILFSFHMCFSQVNELDPVCCNLIVFW